MNKGAGQTQETSQQRAQVQVAQEQLSDWKQRWEPVLTNFSKQLTAQQPYGSTVRNAQVAKAGTDNSAAYAKANEGATLAAANDGSFGSAKQKLGVVNMGNDEATSTGFGTMEANQAVDDSTVSGLSAVTNLAQGNKASTENGMAREAAISGQQAQNDAATSLASRAGDARLAGQVLGTGAGLVLGPTYKPNAKTTYNGLANAAPIGGSGGADLGAFGQLDLSGVN